jgi:hypothetical protein
MTSAQTLSEHLAHAEVNGDHTEAVLHLGDGSRLCFCHRVGERWAKAFGPNGAETSPGVAFELLDSIQLFRLNKKHLDILFQDASRWEEPLR